MKATQTSIDFTSIENRAMVAQIDRFISRISGKPTVATLKNMFLVLPEEKRPTDAFLKAYLKSDLC
jgi:hypothetical protein